MALTPLLHPGCLKANICSSSGFQFAVGGMIMNNDLNYESFTRSVKHSYQKNGR